MATAQIELTETELERLQELSERTGKPREVLLHEAVTHFLSQTDFEERRERLRQTKGIWKNRQILF